VAVAEISTRELPDDELEDRLVRALRARGGRATEADLVVSSGVPPHQVGPALTRMLAQYKSHLAVTDDGDLVYEFDPAMTRRDAVPWARWKRVGRALWAAFTVLYKVLIAVVLVGYVVLFLVLLLAALGALASGGRGRRERRDSWSSTGGRSWLSLGDILWWSTGWGRVRRRPAPGARAPGVPFYRRVFAFVFGPERPAADELADERRLLAFVRARGGVVAPTELAARTGWSLDAAEEESTRLLARYGGDVEVTDDGHILYTFKDLMLTASEDAGADGEAARPVWETWEPRAPVTGNSTGWDVFIGALNAFVLAGATVLVPGFVAPALGLPLAEPLVAYGLVLAPAVYASLFFAIPLARRAWVVGPENRRRAGRNLRRAVLRLAFEGRSPEPADVARAIPPEVPAARDPAVLERAIRGVAFELDAATEATEEGRIVYAWNRIAGEHAAAEARRRGHAGRLVRVGDKALAFTSRA
jgi:hypothetical protein